MPYDSKVHVGASGLLWRDNHLLLLRRAGDRHGSGQWAIPGGWVDYGEVPTQTVAREFEEEVGLHVVMPHLVDVVSHIYPEYGWQCITIAYEVHDADPNRIARNCEPQKASGVVWVHRTQLKELDLFAATNDVLARLGRVH